MLLRYGGPPPAAVLDLAQQDAFPSRHRARQAPFGPWCGDARTARSSGGTSASVSMEPRRSRRARLREANRPPARARPRTVVPAAGGTRGYTAVLGPTQRTRSATSRSWWRTLRRTALGLQVLGGPSSWKNCLVSRFAPIGREGAKCASRPRPKATSTSRCTNSPAAALRLHVVGKPQLPPSRVPRQRAPRPPRLPPPSGPYSSPHPPLSRMSTHRCSHKTGAGAASTGATAIA